MGTSVWRRASAAKSRRAGVADCERLGDEAGMTCSFHHICRGAGRFGRALGGWRRLFGFGAAAAEAGEQGGTEEDAGAKEDERRGLGSACGGQWREYLRVEFAGGDVDGAAVRAGDGVVHLHVRAGTGAG